MGLLRSEEMRQAQLVLPWEGAREYVNAIGRQLHVQFEDMNSREMKRPYRKQIQRLEEMERILRLLTEEITKKITFDSGDITKNFIEGFLQHDSQYKFDDVEKELLRMNAQYVKWKQYNGQLETELSTAREHLEVVKRATGLQGRTGASEPVPGGASAGVSEPLLGGEEGYERRVGCIAGVVNALDETRLRLSIFRTSRNNAYTVTFPIEEELLDPKTGIKCRKSVFVVFFQGAGGASAPLHQKVTRVCNALGVNLYGWPGSDQEAKKQVSNLEKEVQDKEQLLECSALTMKQEMQEYTRPVKAGLNSKVEEFRMFCAKEKSIYSVLNMCTGDYTLRINIWFPASEEMALRKMLQTTADGQGALTKTTASVSMPPTYTRVNDFTEAWQDVINTYGIPRYQEANPALFSCVTFPFIFGMMYGDIGHGSMLLMAGIALCVNAPKLKYSVPIAYYARFIILQLGLFALFAGFMYNDFFSISLRLFHSRYHDLDGDGNWDPNFDVENKGGDGPYPFGLDWAWNGAGNELLFVNSLKMKLSVLFGVLQMTFGVFLRWSNALYEGNMLDFFFECVPMLVFMVCFFGWMDYMVLYKWTHTDAPNGPPSIINSLICMAMGQDDLFPVYPGSVELSKTLMAFTMLSVPFILFPKPFILKSRDAAAKKKLTDAGSDSDSVEEVEEAQAGHGGGHGHGEEFEFGEVLIHQVIETIEYVLGTVSHTASYLRIWALSLAHQQLSMVFFEKTIAMGLTMAFPMNGIMLYCMFTAWFGVTVAVLLGMDVLECFLHTLRLHWVEFQSKFYKADGYLFDPFNIEKIVTPLEDA